MKSSDPPQVIFAIGFLAGKQFITVDEIGGQHLLHGIQVPLGYSCLHEAAGQSHVLLCRHRNSSPCQLGSFSNGSATTYMMPPGEAGRIDQELFHPSAWW